MWILFFGGEGEVDWWGRDSREWDGWMGWRVEKRDMIDGRAGTWLRVATDVGVGGAVCGWEGRRGKGGMLGENFLWRERGVQWSVSLK
jgi:hypothetical protein